MSSTSRIALGASLRAIGIDFGVNLLFGHRGNNVAAHRAADIEKLLRGLSLYRGAQRPLYALGRQLPNRYRYWI